MSKKYRLKKDMPQCAAGTVFVKYSEDAVDYIAEDKEVMIPVGINKLERFFLHDKIVEDNTEWFEEIKEPENIEVFGPWDIGSKVDLSNQGWFRVNQFHTTDKIPKEKLSSIKQAIEEVLNGGRNLEEHLSRMNIVDTNGAKLYTEKEVEERERDAFNAARRLSGAWQQPQVTYAGHEFFTFNHYKESKNQNNNK